LDSYQSFLVLEVKKFCLVLEVKKFCLVLEVKKFIWYWR
jgi:hypothetical protein